MTLLAFLWFRPMHGYEIRRHIEEQKRDRWADIQYGSIYQGLRQLAKEGLVEEAGTEREGNRPPRTVYRITEVGREELLRSLRQMWAEPTFSARPMDVALSFVWLLPFEEVERLLEERLGRLDEISRELDEAQEQAVSPDPGIGAMVSDLFDHSRRLLAVEREWTENVLSRLRDGAYEIREETRRAWGDKDAEHDLRRERDVRGRS